MEELLTILNDVDDSIDWEHEEGLIDNRILDSFGVISLVAELTRLLILRSKHPRSSRRISILCKPFMLW